VLGEKAGARALLLEAGVGWAVVDHSRKSAVTSRKSQESQVTVTKYTQSQVTSHKLTSHKSQVFTESAGRYCMQHLVV